MRLTKCINRVLTGKFTLSAAMNAKPGRSICKRGTWQLRRSSIICGAVFSLKSGMNWLGETGLSMRLHY